MIHSLTQAEALAKVRAAAPTREQFLARFHDDGHTARIIFQDNAQPDLRITCPHANRLRQDMATIERETWDPGCDDKVCWLRDWYSDIAWEAIEVATYPEDDPQARWPQWIPSTVEMRLLWRWDNEDEFYFTLDDLLSTAPEHEHVYSTSTLQCVAVEGCESTISTEEFIADVKREAALSRGWLCNLHGVTGAGDDGSLARHEAEQHDGMTITITMLPPP